LSIALLSSGCASDRAVLGRAFADMARAEAAPAAIESGRDIPDIPADCRKREASGVREGDRLDVALVKSERALGRANVRIDRCAAWHDDYRAGRGMQ
jgi:hypothetical protein